MLVAVLGTAVLYGIGWLATGRRRDGVVPAAVLGGLLGLALRQFDLLPGSIGAYQDIGYHLFGISFLAIGLTRSETGGTTAGAVWLGVGAGMVFALQALAGGVVTALLRATGRDLFPTFGFLAPMGLEEGPGQAVSVGGIWEAAGFDDAVALGATIASLGFLIAYGLGLVALRMRSPRTARDRGPGRRATPVRPESARVDPPRMVGTVLSVVATYVVLYATVSALAGLAGPEVRDTVLGVLFFLALLVGMALRAVLDRTGHRVDPLPQRRLTVWAVDGLTVAILASLAWSSIAGQALPLTLVLLAAVAATGVVVVLASRRLPEPRFERGLALFGTVTGTVSSGLALVSLTDPEHRERVAVELGGAVVVSAPFVLGGVAVATATTQGALALSTAMGVFAAVAVATAAVLWWLAARMSRT